MKYILALTFLAIGAVVGQMGAPVVAIPVEFGDDQTAYLEVFEGQLIRDAVNDFCRTVGLDLSIADQLVAAIDTRWTARQTRIQNAKAEQARVGRKLGGVSVPVSISVPLTMDLDSGEDSTIAALNFARKHELSPNEIPQLIKLMDDEVARLTALANQPRELVSFDIDLDGTPTRFSLQEGEEPRAAAEKFLSQHGILAEDNIRLIVDNVVATLNQRTIKY